jgi:hypothetical protein
MSRSVQWRRSAVYEWVPASRSFMTITDRKTRLAMGAHRKAAILALRRLVTHIFASEDGVRGGVSKFRGVEYAHRISMFN